MTESRQEWLRPRSSASEIGRLQIRVATLDSAPSEVQFDGSADPSVTELSSEPVRLDSSS